MNSYFEHLIGLGQYGLAVVIVLTLFCLVGQSVLISVRLHGSLGAADLILLSPIVGASISSIPLALLANQGVAISSVTFWLVIAILASPYVYFQTTRLRNRQSVAWCSGSDLRRLIIIPLAAFVGLLPYLQLMIKSVFTPGFGTSATWTNNDLGAYIQMATNVGKSGIKDAGYIEGWNAGLQASFDHPSAHSFFVAIGRILNRQPFQVGIVLMVTVVAMMFLVAIFVIKQLSHSTNSSLLFVASVVVINPPVVAAVCNFFYPQLFSLSIVFGYLAVALIAYRQIENLLGPLLLALMAVSVALVSIEMSVVLIPLVSLFAFAINFQVSWKAMILKTVCAFTLVFGLLFIAEHDLFISQYDVLVRLSGSGVAGWKSNFASFAMIFGMVPSQYSGPYSEGTKFFDIGIFVALAVLCISRVLENRKNSIVAASLFVPIGIVVVAVQKWGIDGYQTWKLITSFTPLFMMLLVSLLLMGKNSERVMSVVAISMLTVGATFSWSGFVWKDAQASSFINPDVAEVALSASAGRQDGINILLSPFFETMAVSAITGVPSHLSSMTYQFSTGQELRYNCTLTTLDKVAEISNPGPIVHRRGDYVLVGSPQCR